MLLGFTLTLITIAILLSKLGNYLIKRQLKINNYNPYENNDLTFKHIKKSQ